MKRTFLLLLILFALLFVSCGAIDTSLIDASMFEKEAEIFTVSFETDGGSIVNSIEVEENCTVKRPHSPTKEGYVFDAWYTEDDTKWLFLNGLVEYDMTLYAKWLPIQTVNFVTDYGTIPENQQVGYGRYATMPEITYDGYYIEGWYDEYDNLWSFDEFPIKRDMTFTAKWKKTVNVSVNGETKTLIPGTEIGKLPHPVKSGAYFIGWFRSNELSALVPVNETTVFYENTTLIPKWEENENVILITLDTGEGWLHGCEKQINSEIGAKLTCLPEANSLGNSYFLGWYDENGVRYSKNSVLYEDITLYARYQFRTECQVNESKEHNFTPWDYDPKFPSCTEDALAKRYCYNCNEYEYKYTEDAYGHKYNNDWTYSFMQKSRKCYVCDYEQIVEFSDVTDVVNNVFLTGEAYNKDKVDCLFNGNWNDANTDAFCGKDDTPLTVSIRLKSPTSVNGIYLKGTGANGVDVLVKFQGDTEFTRIAISTFDSEPVLTHLPNRPITEIKLTMQFSGEGTCLWQEVALVKIPNV